VREQSAAPFLGRISDSSRIKSAANWEALSHPANEDVATSAFLKSRDNAAKFRPTRPYETCDGDNLSGSNDQVDLPQPVRTNIAELKRGDSRSHRFVTRSSVIKVLWQISLLAGDQCTQVAYGNIYNST
jgi:hypothetical protein